MSEWDHFRGRGKCIVDLSYGAKPTAHVCNIFRCGEVDNIVHKILSWLDARICDLKSQVLDRFLTKLELFWVENYSLAGASLKEGTDLLKVGLDVW